ncbi:hypothetical protein NLA05_20495 [Xanthomonas citri pv. anacardii]|uniref:hypothetical protein n=1 Tax=Xanthomonas citri TaxID=346 RepID=UPI002154FD7F|nr:hypothetical protein [Xanthomonas citri]MCT8362658.1 hypothetical protein [Xanthomonas citri pv. anacardii]MCT8366688.1 hypothetical protein [Xanthomonas citri pv. anacardii]MCT8378782.1 hypothetical protein [Xanthomonas citri pv. anacardii]MCT8382808.1 hypothetical protein [Xanthomonas citri pv. anacardii]
MFGLRLGILGQGGEHQQAPGRGLIGRPAQGDAQQTMRWRRLGGVYGTGAQQANGQAQARGKTMQGHADL